MNRATEDAMARVWEGYGVGARLEERLFRAMGFHTGSEILADQEFVVLDKALRARRPDLVAGLEDMKVAILGQRHDAYYWIRIHTGVEAEHFDAALRASTTRSRFYAGPEPLGDGEGLDPGGVPRVRRRAGRVHGAPGRVLKSLRLVTAGRRAVLAGRRHRSPRGPRARPTTSPTTSRTRGASSRRGRRSGSPSSTSTPRPPAPCPTPSRARRPRSWGVRGPDRLRFYSRLPPWPCSRCCWPRCSCSAGASSGETPAGLATTPARSIRT